MIAVYVTLFLVVFLIVLPLICILWPRRKDYVSMIGLNAIGGPPPPPR